MTKPDKKSKSRVVLPHDSDRVESYFTLPTNYAAYVKRTNEKMILQKEIQRAYESNELPIKSTESNKRILDLGCGLGSNTQFLLELFETHEIFAIDVSGDMVDYAQKNLIVPKSNVSLEKIAFEDYHRYGFDFILCSHTLQYIDTDLSSFLRKIVECLNADGEAWIILQEEKGINEIVQMAVPYLDKPSHYFTKWFTHDLVRKFFMNMGIEITTKKITSFFKMPDLEDPSDEDIALMNFILLDGFEYSNSDLLVNIKELITAISTQTGLIPHEIGISRVKRR